KYLRSHPVDRLTIGGGFAKLSKLAVGHLDLHSGRSQIDLDYLADQLQRLDAGDEIIERARTANTALEVLDLARADGLALADLVAADARRVAIGVLDGAPVEVDVLVVDRQGNIIGSNARDETP